MTRGGRDGLGILIALAVLTGCCAAVAYTAVRSNPPDADQAGGARGSTDARAPAPKRGPRPPKPRIGRHPDSATTSRSAQFTFTDRQPAVQFACRVDRVRWRRCRSPLAIEVAAGRHTFSVRAVSHKGVRSPAARFRWSRLEARRFSIVPDLAGLNALYPGAAPVSLPLTISNPNPSPIEVTELRVAVSADPPGCASAENLVLSAGGVSRARPLTVPGRSSVKLPARGFTPPTIQLRDLPVSQDACQAANFPLEFTGKARG